MMTLLEGPQNLPISLSHVKAYLRLDRCEEDEYLLQLIKSATQMIESYLGRSLLRQMWSFLWQKEDAFHKNQITSNLVKPNRIPLRFPPVLDIKSVQYIDSENKKQKIKRYSVDVKSETPFLLVSSFYETVEVVYEAGYGFHPSSIPASITHAILATVAEFYENREAISVPVNKYVFGLLQPHRLLRLG